MAYERPLKSARRSFRFAERIDNMLTKLAERRVQGINDVVSDLIRAEFDRVFPTPKPRPETAKQAEARLHKEEVSKRLCRVGDQGVRRAKDGRDYEYTVVWLGGVTGAWDVVGHPHHPATLTGPGTITNAELWAVLDAEQPNPAIHQISRYR